MAENVIFIPISRYVVTLAALSILTSMLDQCHGQWWFPTTPAMSPPPSPSPSPSPPTSSTNTSTIPTSPSTSFTTPGTSPLIGFPTTPPSSSNLSTISPPALTGFPTVPAVFLQPSTAPTNTPTTSTTHFVMPTTFGFVPQPIYTSVQAAIDAVPENNTGLVTIEIFAGTYTEKVTIPSTKPFITIQGAGRARTIITYNDTANSTGSTLKSTTFAALADNFTARNITFQNSAPQAIAGERGAQAVALRIAGDMAAFYGCGFVSSQDTICDEAGRHYFRDCYVEGNIDIIWGNGQSLYEYCEIESTADNSSGCITAQSRASADETTGFSFVGGSITGTGYNLLGRGYGLYSRVFFIDTYMDDIIDPLGWRDWPTFNDSTRSLRLLASTTRHEYYGEYGNTGPGANLTGRVSWMINLTAADAAYYSSMSFIDGQLWITSET